jgi:hypothetical protein
MEEIVTEKTERDKTRLPVAEFFELYDVKRSDIAEELGVLRQQITNWQSSNTDYLIEYYPASGEIKVIKPEEIVKSCLFGKLETK